MICSPYLQFDITEMSLVDFYSAGSRNLPSVKRLYADNFVFLDPNLLEGLGMMTSIRVLTLYGAELNDKLTAHGIDLSCNKLTGEIPPEMGSLSEIHALNLSHNNLSGSIPVTFSNLRQLESLDLSYNHLNGNIPSQLTELNSLAVFSVAHNNLSGRTPGYKGSSAAIEPFSIFELICSAPMVGLLSVLFDLSPAATSLTESPTTLMEKEGISSEADLLVRHFSLEHSTKLDVSSMM
ncbi:hypothetical protein Ancab_015177 [Ancistrocladus abbreviatus]